MPGGASKGKTREDSTNTATRSSPSELDMPESGSSNAPEDNWAMEKDPGERRRIQNRLAQRKFRERAKQEKEDRLRELEDNKRAALAYTLPDPNDLESRDNQSGLPWGGYNLRYAMVSSRSQERTSGQSSTADSPSNTGQGRGLGSR
ncbi:MAG: hypothetical protein M1840_000979 [Geoglossum simile]|nr:MAG: hypothetical protein M1840_000979 [Geoglossum simile]